LTGAPNFCLNCGAKPGEGARFCPECGAPTHLIEVCTDGGARVAPAITRKTWKPMVAGILCIVTGVIDVLLALLFLPNAAVGAISILGGIYALRRRIWALAIAGSIFSFIGSVILGIVVMLFLFSDQPHIIPFGATIFETLAIVFSNSSIVRFIAILGIPGILALIFVIMGKREFE
jgi:hypothetical protein